MTPDNTARKQFYAGISAQSITDRGFIPESMILFILLIITFPQTQTEVERIVLQIPLYPPLSFNQR